MEEEEAVNDVVDVDDDAAEDGYAFAISHWQWNYIQFTSRLAPWSLWLCPPPLILSN